MAIFDARDFVLIHHSPNRMALRRRWFIQISALAAFNGRRVGYHAAITVRALQSHQSKTLRPSEEVTRWAPLCSNSNFMKGEQWPFIPRRTHLCHLLCPKIEIPFQTV